MSQSQCATPSKPALSLVEVWHTFFLFYTNPQIFKFQETENCIYTFRPQQGISPKFVHAICELQTAKYSQIKKCPNPITCAAF